MADNRRRPAVAAWRRARGRVVPAWWRRAAVAPGLPATGRRRWRRASGWCSSTPTPARCRAAGRLFRSAAAGRAPPCWPAGSSTFPGAARWRLATAPGGRSSASGSHWTAPAPPTRRAPTGGPEIRVRRGRRLRRQRARRRGRRPLLSPGRAGWQLEERPGAVVEHAAAARSPGWWLSWPPRERGRVAEPPLPGRVPAAEWSAFGRRTAAGAEALATAAGRRPTVSGGGRRCRRRWGRTRLPATGRSCRRRAGASRRREGSLRRRRRELAGAALVELVGAWPLSPAGCFPIGRAGHS